MLPQCSAGPDTCPSSLGSVQPSFLVESASCCCHPTAPCVGWHICLPCPSRGHACVSVLSLLVVSRHANRHFLLRFNSHSHPTCSSSMAALEPSLTSRSCLQKAFQLCYHNSFTLSWYHITTSLM